MTSTTWTTPRGAPSVRWAPSHERTDRRRYRRRPRTPASQVRYRLNWIPPPPPNADVTGTVQIKLDPAAAPERRRHRYGTDQIHPGGLMFRARFSGGTLLETWEERELQKMLLHDTCAYADRPQNVAIRKLQILISSGT